MSLEHDRARADFARFEQDQPDNFFRADPDLRRILARWSGEDVVRRWEPNLDSAGIQFAGPADRAARVNGRRHNLPELERWSGFGERIEQVEHHPSHHEVGRAIYAAGVLSVLGERGSNLRSLALFYLSSLNGEAGHNCPVAATAGLIKALVALGSDSMRERYLPRLLTTNYDTRLHGTQFLTEVQGGSDVGANQVRADPVEGTPGSWRIFGEKWFCSNATADLILMTARATTLTREGTAGLGLFLVPKHMDDGRHNAFAYRRLKDKLGTQSMASAEIDFDGAVAYNLGPVEGGFHNMLKYVINVSRLFNGVGTAALARRACHVARGYARQRRAFGATIIDYPLVQETLCDMSSEAAAMASGSLYLAHVMDRIETGQGTPEEEAFFRVALNLNKMRSALSSHEVIHSAIEVLGGNGTIESFSVLPRLLRDNIVYENWEGTHNTLLMQLLRDCRRKQFHRGFFANLEKQAAKSQRVVALLRSAASGFDAALASDDATAPLRMRALGHTLGWLQWASAMVDDGAETIVLDHFLDRRFGPSAERDRKYLDRLTRLCSEERT